MLSLYGKPLLPSGEETEDPNQGCVGGGFPPRPGFRGGGGERLCKYAVRRSMRNT